MMTLTPEIIRAEVARFWDAFSSKNADLLEEFYAHQSSCFGSLSTRSEPGRLAATRRKREYFSSAANLRAQFGSVDVVMLDEQAAVASYVFQFHASKIGAQGTQEEHIQNGRATQVIAFDHDGKLRIFHEHFSLPHQL